MKSLLLISMAFCPQLVVELPAGVSSDDSQKHGQVTNRPAAVVTYHVIGLKKTKSGAT